MLSAGDFSPARSPTIYSSPIESPAWDERSDDDDDDDDDMNVPGLANALNDKLAILEEEEERLRDRYNLQRDVVLLR